MFNLSFCSSVELLVQDLIYRWKILNLGPPICYLLDSLGMFTAICQQVCCIKLAMSFVLFIGHRVQLLMTWNFPEINWFWLFLGPWFLQHLAELWTTKRLDESILAEKSLAFFIDCQLSPKCKINPLWSNFVCCFFSIVFSKLMWL